MSRRADAVADSSTYMNIDYESWAEEGFNIAITLYDGKYTA